MDARSTSVAEQYARALLDCLEARPERERPQCETEIALAAEVARRTPSLARFLRSPVVEPARKLKIFEEALPGARPLTRRFLEVLIERERADLLPEIHAAYERLRDERRQVVVAEVSSAVPLDRQAAERCAQALRQATGREVRLSLTQDPLLLGGVRTRIGSRLFDSSVRARLDILRRKLSED